MMKPLNFKSGMIRWLMIIAVLQFSVFSAKAIHPDLDTSDVWVRINDGFAKCASIGESAGEAWWSQDNWRLEAWVHKRGVMYAYINYNNSTGESYQ